MERKEILDTAARCVLGDREQDYGTPEDNFSLKGELINKENKSKNYIYMDLSNGLGQFEGACLVLGNVVVAHTVLKTVKHILNKIKGDK